MNTEPKVLIAIPTAGGLHERTSIWQTIVCSRNSNYTPGVFRGRPVDHVRNGIIRLFLQHTGLTHLLLIDSDTEPPLDAVERLLATQQKITRSTGRPVMTTGCYPVLMHEGLCWALADQGTDGHYRLIKRHKDPVRPSRVDAGGAGCLLIPREILASTPAPWFLWIERPDGSQMSEDIYFFDRMNAAGYQTWADPQVICKHYKEIELTSLTELIEREVQRRVTETQKQLPTEPTESHREDSCHSREGGNPS